MEFHIWEEKRKEEEIFLVFSNFRRIRLEKVFIAIRSISDSKGKWWWRRRLFTINFEITSPSSYYRRGAVEYEVVICDRKFSPLRSYLLFWYHVFTWVSVSCSLAASSILSCTLRYFCRSKLFSRVWSWWSVKAVRAFLCFLLCAELSVLDDELFGSSSLPPGKLYRQCSIKSLSRAKSYRLIRDIELHGIGIFRAYSQYIFFPLNPSN